PFPRHKLPHTRNRFTPNFQGWGLDENLKLKSPPYRGSHIDVRWQDKNEVGLAARAAMPRTRPGTSIHGHRDATMMLVAYRHGLRASEVCDLPRPWASWCRRFRATPASSGRLPLPPR